MTIEAKPCPFCGATEVEVVQGDTFRWRLAQCQQCGAQGPEVRIQTMGTGTLEEWERSAVQRALEDWNQRKGPPPLEAMVV